MEIQSRGINAEGIEFFIEDGKKGREIGRAFLYILKNKLHKKPFGFMEDVFVEENFRGKGYGVELVKAVILEARKRKCYKLICTSRHSKPKVHDLYQRLGFKNHGVEFRIDF